jgi:hypothetical protein
MARSQSGVASQTPKQAGLNQCLTGDLRQQSACVEPQRRSPATSATRYAACASIPVCQAEERRQRRQAKAWGPQTRQSFAAWVRPWVARAIHRDKHERIKDATPNSLHSTCKPVMAATDGGTRGVGDLTGSGCAILTCTGAEAFTGLVVTLLCCQEHPCE